MQKKLIQLYGKLRFGLLVVTLFQGKGHAKGTQGTQADNRQRTIGISSEVCGMVAVVLTTGAVVSAAVAVTVVGF